MSSSTENVQRLSTRNALFTTCLCLLSAVSAFFLTKYLRFENPTLSSVVLFGAMLFAIRFVLRNETAIARKHVVVSAVFSFLLSLSLVVGFHIEIGDSPYAGLLAENYITPYSKMDLVGFFFIAVEIFILSLSVLLLSDHTLSKSIQMPSNQTDKQPVSCVAKKNAVTIDKRMLILCAILLELVWLPYLFTYWPGFIFGDSVSSISQALGFEQWTNHHPALYTAFISCCLHLGQLLGVGNTGGCAIYSIIQMTFMAFTFSYMANWITSRGRLSWSWGIAITMASGMAPYIATYSIAMWKDPFFSCGIVLLTLFLADGFIFKEEIKASKVQLFALAAILALICFSRNNGVYIVLTTWTALGITLLVQGCKRKICLFDKSIMLIGAAVVVVYYIITGPVYAAVGVNQASKAEGLGVPLNQMARVVAYQGDMSESDRAYMNELLPINLYETTYRPCCTDLLKWDQAFNASALDDSFMKHWLSMGLKNPRAYFDAWSLQTCGFWAINIPEVNEFNNIGGGVPRDSSALTFADIETNASRNQLLQSLFPQDSTPTLPLAVVIWGTFFLFISCLCAHRRIAWTVALVPSLALAGTLVIASPIWYWPRYGAALHFLLPFFIFFSFLLFKNRKKKDPPSRRMSFQVLNKIHLTEKSINRRPAIRQEQAKHLQLVGRENKNHRK